MADLFYLATSILTVATLMPGLANPARSSFDLQYRVLCVRLPEHGVRTEWSFNNRFQAVELSTREQNLRLECRLADLAERLGKTK